MNGGMIPAQNNLAMYQPAYSMSYSQPESVEKIKLQSLHQLLDNNKDLFTKSLQKLKQTPEGEHIIITEEVSPIKKRAYRMTPKGLMIYLASGYWQIKVRAEDQKKTALSQNLEYKVLQEIKEKFVLVYLDDIIIYSKTFKDHLQYLEEEAFENLRDKLTTAPIVQYPDFSKPFFLYTDALIIGLGVILAQKNDDQEHVIAYASETLIPAEKNYTITELECLAIVWAVKYFQHYLCENMSGAHLGIDAIIGKIKNRYYWPQLREDVKEYIRTCNICQRREHTNQ
ncbi:uncharacterized protein K02A2.6-like [Rhizophagus irregularis DAOM 181602=DAOM 197198]|nr:uncharacterized protein K02A2.6-like [Rhizophagus irregularis DAOM 181602=DAOM 197198]